MRPYLPHWQRIDAAYRRAVSGAHPVATRILRPHFDRVCQAMIQSLWHDRSFGTRLMDRFLRTHG